MEILIFFISFLAAFLFSLGGVGAAIILIPILVSLGIPINTAKPVGLFYNTVSHTGASINNIRNKRLDFKAGIPIIIFSFLFAILGAWMSKFIPARIILFLFIGFLLFSGIMFLLHKKKASDQYRTGNPYVLPDTVSYTGNDFRFNVFARFKTKIFEIQGEYLHAGFDRGHAYGFYLLSALNIKKNQIVFSWEDYHSLIPETSDRPAYRVGYNYLIDKYKLKLFFDNYFRTGPAGLEKYFATIQLQLFFR